MGLGFMGLGLYIYIYMGLGLIKPKVSGFRVQPVPIQKPAALAPKPEKSKTESHRLMKAQALQTGNAPKLQKHSKSRSRQLSKNEMPKQKGNPANPKPETPKPQSTRQQQTDLYLFRASCICACPGPAGR